MAVAKGGSLAAANLALFLSVYIGWTAYSAVPFLASQLGDIGAAVTLVMIFAAAGLGAMAALRISLFVPLVIVLGTVVVVIPFGYLLTVTIGNSLPTGSIGAQQGQQLSQLVDTSASAIGLSSVILTAGAAAIIILAMFLFMRFTTGRYMESARP